MDLITYGKEPDGTLAANVGIYSPIGTESSSIIQFYLSMGWVDEAKRAVMYFFDTQQDNGGVANYSGYMVETGAVLWNVGEYFRYTNDTEWILKLMPKILKSCDYLMKWRDENKRKDAQKTTDTPKNNGEKNEKSCNYRYGSNHSGRP